MFPSFQHSVVKDSNRPCFSFGVISDVQYADIPNGRSFFGTPRYYRHSLEALRQAVTSWNEQGDISFVIHFGDIVDGRCPKESSLSAVQKVVSEFQAFESGPVYHILGNHCLYNLPRHKLNELLDIPSQPDGSSYYSFSPFPGFRFVILDGYDISVLGWPENHDNAKTAARILREKNPNEDKNSPLGMGIQDQRFVMFNGGVGKEQLKWLEQELEQATESEEKVIVCCHIPLYMGATFPDTLLWNAEEVMNVIHKYRCVVACLAGHKHEGGYDVDEEGIHHKVLEAVLECPPGENAFGRVDVFGDEMRLIGSGRLVSCNMHFNSQTVR